MSHCQWLKLGPGITIWMIKNEDKSIKETKKSYVEKYLLRSWWILLLNYFYVCKIFWTKFLQILQGTIFSYPLFDSLLEQLTFFRVLEINWDLLPDFATNRLISDSTTDKIVAFSVLLSIYHSSNCNLNPSQIEKHSPLFEEISYFWIKTLIFIAK